MKGEDDVPVPAGETTVIGPVAPAPVIALMSVSETIEKDAAATPPNLTAVAYVKLAPIMVMVLPAMPLDGVNELITGGEMKVNP